jgi:hypothetical protein
MNSSVKGWKKNGMKKVPRQAKGIANFSFSVNFRT